MGLQIFGTRKCPATRKAERFFKERGARCQFIDLAEKGMSPGELKSVLAAIGSPGDASPLLDREGERFKRRGLAYLEFDAEAELLADPLLLKTPIVRDGRRASVGEDPKAWAAFLDG